MCRSNNYDDQGENGKVADYKVEFEEALYLTGTGKFHNVLLLICGLGIFGVMMETFGISFLLPSAQCDFNLTPGDKGLLNALYPIGMICGSHMWGYIADTRGRKVVLVAALILDGTVAVLSSFSHALWLFKCFRFLCGFIAVGAASVMYAYFGEFHSSTTRNKGLMWLSVFIGLGIATQPGVAWLIIPQSWVLYLPWCIYNSWRMFIIVCALPNLVAGISMYFILPETPKFLISQGRDEETLNVLKHMYMKNTGNSPEKYSVKSIILLEDDATQVASSGSRNAFVNLLLHMWNQTAPLFKPPFLWKTLLACFVQFGLYASANGISLWLPEIFNTEASYYALHPDSEATVCQIFESLPPVYQMTTEPLLKVTPQTFHLKPNDTISLNCDNNNLILNINNFTNVVIKENTNFLDCHEYLNDLNGNNLMVDVKNGGVIFTVVNSSMSSYLELFNTDKGIAIDSSLSNDDIMCDSSVDLSAFQNTLIIGTVSALCYLVVGFLIGPVGKKRIIVVSLISGGICGIFLGYVPGSWQFFVLALAFVNLSGMCITVMVSAVVELFPTNFRAMAVCLSLMCGRIGSFSANLLMGTLLQTNCIIMTYLLGGICACCGVLSIFLPSPKKTQP